ncbi:MAG: NAD(P)H-dependent oxidoreductase subunit E [Christensenellales bacterium]|jgi:NADH:ubiquinone oxidoreductase subunit E
MGKIAVEVCAGSHCTMMGAMDIVAALESLADLQELRDGCEMEIKVVPCLGTCDHGKQAPVVIVNGSALLKADMETVMSMVVQSAKKANCL